MLEHFLNFNYKDRQKKAEERYNRKNDMVFIEFCIYIGLHLRALPKARQHNVANVTVTTTAATATAKIPNCTNHSFKSLEIEVLYPGKGGGTK